MAAWICINCSQIEASDTLEPCCEHEDLVCINDMPREIRESRILLKDLRAQLDSRAGHYTVASRITSMVVCALCFMLGVLFASYTP